jgi:hypothetical protein
MRHARFAAALLGLVLAGALAACGPGSSHGAAGRASASAAAASAKALFEADVPLQNATRTALDEVQLCARTTQGIIVTLPLPYSGQQPVFTHVPVKALKHPVTALEAIIACTPAGQDNGAKAKQCALSVAGANGAHHGVLGKDLTDVAVKCLVPASASPTAVPSPATPSSPAAAPSPAAS